MKHSTYSTGKYYTYCEQLTQFRFKIVPKIPLV